MSLAVREGELLAVIGPNGAGKTSLFNLITGLTRPTGGAVLLDGHDITALPPHRRVRRGVGRTFQSSSVFATMTVAEHVDLAARSAGVRRVGAGTSPACWSGSGWRTAPGIRRPASRTATSASWSWRCCSRPPSAGARPGRG